MDLYKSYLKWFLTIGIAFTVAVFLWLILIPSISSNLFFLNYSLQRFLLITITGIFLLSLSIGLVNSNKRSVNSFFIKYMASKIVFSLFFISTFFLMIAISGVFLKVYGVRAFFFERILPILLLSFLFSFEVVVFQQIISKGEMGKSMGLSVSLLPGKLRAASRHFFNRLNVTLNTDQEKKLEERKDKNPSHKEVNLLQKIVNLTWDKFLVICGVFGVLLPISPMNMPLSYRDSGVFLYMGWRILNGALPYRDVWDHKPPIIFYINALGLFIVNYSRWGVWLLELISLFLAVFIGFRLTKKTFGTLPALLSMLIWLLTLVFVIWGGNFTTEYTLPLQFAALLLVYDIEKSDNPLRRWFLIGLLGAIAFFTKQTAIGIWVAIVLYQTFHQIKSRQVKKWIKELLFLTTGFLTISISWVIIFGSNGALAQFWNAVFEYNFAYTRSVNGLIPRLDSLIKGLAPLLQVGLLQVAMAGYVVGLVLICFKKSIVRDWSPLLLIGLIDLPIELILISTSGRSYPHYYMTLLPVLSLFAGLMVWIFLLLLSALGVKFFAKNVVVISVVGIFLWCSYPIYWSKVLDLRSAGNETVIDYIRHNTSPDDYVLLWGAESSINYFTQLKSPSRFVYQYPLYSPDYVDEQMILEFLDDIIRNRPLYIVDTMNPVTPIYDFPIKTEAVMEKITYLQQHYRVVNNIDSWIAYKYVEDGGNP
ncbi:MAG: hypothetical protein C0410_05375 [Anaerolinea sp.]|nr:hypothetical protein [Anaerolinea sp.]